VVFSVVMFAMSTMALHRLPAFVERGIEPTWVAWSTAFDATLASISTLLMGTLGARVPVRFLGGVGLSLMGASAWVLVVGDGIAAMFLSMGLFGFGIGGLLYMQNIIWADYFGRAHIGAIRGVVNPITMLMGAAGAPIAGYVYDYTGSYEPVWWASTGLMLIGALAVVVTPPPTIPAALPSAQRMD
jgi:MFS family permease